jgi:hypothetical protein
MSIAACRRFYRTGGFVKADPRKKTAEALDRIKQGYAEGGITRVLKAIRNKAGASQAQRMERAADSVDLSKYSQQGLREAFMPEQGGIPGLFTTMPPDDFERFAVPISQRMQEMTPYPRWGNVPYSVLRKTPMEDRTFENYLDNIGGLINKRGMAEPPMLWMGKQGRELPNIVGHEGRHRMRALDQMGEDQGLVLLRPANPGELRGDPDEVVSNMLTKYFKNDPEGQLFHPESHTIIPRRPVDFPDPVFAGGGPVSRWLGKLKEAGSGYEPKMGLPKQVRLPDVGLIEPHPLVDVEQASRDYMRKFFNAPLDETTPLRPLNEPFSRRVAQAYDEMPNDPTNPRVRRAYDALIDETMQQYRALGDLGYDFRFNADDPYARSPGLGYADLVNNRRLSVFPTEAGYGSGVGDSSQNPLLRRVGRVGDLPDATANDAFRIVHDMYGHFGPGNPFFRAPGEERAYQLHSRMYGPEARRAAATELRGQNSWVNYGPRSLENRGASGADTIYAPQTVNIMPDWARDLPPLEFKKGGIVDLIKSWRTRTAEKLEKEGAELNAGRDIKLPYLSPEVNKRLQTVDDPARVMFPGIYKDVPDLLTDARARWLPDPGESGPMYELFGHTRGSLDDLAQENRFLQSIGPPEPPWSPPARARGAATSEQVLTDRNARRIQNVIGEALEDPQLRTTRAWYELSPMYDWMTKHGLGPEVQRGLNTRMGVMSPGSNPVTEINRGFHAHYLAPQQRWEDLAQYGALPVKGRPDHFPEDLMGLTPHPYMNTAAMPNLRSFETTGELSSAKHKVPTYVMASDPVWANATRPVADAHFTRFLGYPDVRGSGQTAGLRKELSGSEYGDLLPWWTKKIAKPLGIDERDAQALMWNVGGPQTGVSYIGQPKLEMISNYLGAAAKRLGLPLDEAAYEVLSGRSPGYAEGGLTPEMKRYHPIWAEPFAGGGDVGKWLRTVRNKAGAFQAERMERAADTTNLTRFSDEGLETTFMPREGSRAPKFFTAMPPSRFEDFSTPLPAQLQTEVPYRRWGSLSSEYTPKPQRTFDQYVENMARSIEGRGLDEAPSLNLHHRFDLPDVSAHEGRHRMRALDRLGDNQSLVVLNPRSYSLGDDPQKVLQDTLQRYFDGGDYRVYPQDHDMLSRPVQSLPGGVWARGGKVDDYSKYHATFWDGWSP